jgi:citrate lyase gamma subunit
MFNYFLRFGEVELRIQPQKSKEIKFVIISMLKRQSFKVQHILNILKKELNI